LPKCEVHRDHNGVVGAHLAAFSAAEKIMVPTGFNLLSARAHKDFVRWEEG